MAALSRQLVPGAKVLRVKNPGTRVARTKLEMPNPLANRRKHPAAGIEKAGLS